MHYIIPQSVTQMTKHNWFKFKPEIYYYEAGMQLIRIYMIEFALIFFFKCHECRNYLYKSDIILICFIIGATLIDVTI